MAEGGLVVGLFADALAFELGVGGQAWAGEINHLPVEVPRAEYAAALVTDAALIAAGALSEILVIQGWVQDRQTIALT